MKANSRIIIAAILAVGAICALAFPAIAGCPEDDPACKLIPPESREVRVSSSEADLDFSEAYLSHALAPIPMPPPTLLQPITGVIGSISLAPEFTTIALPLRHQDSADVSCGAQALGMALEPLEGAAPSSAAILEFLRQHDYLYSFGTGVEELALTAQEFGYAGSVSFHNWSLDDLQTELAAGRPVVIDLGANGVDEPGHFVTLTGISPDSGWVAYSDPLLGERVAPLDEFLSLWALQGNSGVAVAEAPPAPLSPDYAPWTALAAAMMATLALGPSVLADVRRRGIGGMLVAKRSSGGATTHVGIDPPYSAPEGMKWVKGKAVYETRTRTEIVYHQIAKRELQKVQVGTTIERVPYTKRILVDNGRWVTDYKTQRYIKGYRNKRILDGYKTQRYVKYYRTRLYRNRWDFSRRRTPVYGYKRVPVYRTVRVPIYGTRKVPNGRHWESKWEYEQYTEYKTVRKPIYEDQWVTIGYERIPEEKIVEEQVTVGFQWTLESAKEPLPARPEIDIIDEMPDIRASIPHPKLMITTAPLRIRSSPGVGSASLTIANDGAQIIWTGNTQVLDTGATWYQVRYNDPIKGLVKGWVHSSYLETPVHIPEPSTDAESSVDTARTEALGRWLHYYSPEERTAYIAAEKLKLEAFWSEIRRLTIPQGGIGGGIESLFIREEADIQFKPPEWYLNGGMPDSFYQQHLLDEQTLRALQVIFMNPGSLSGEVTDRTWDIVANALHMSQEDLKTHVLGNAPWSPESTTSVGSYPIRLYVTRPHGHYLLENPSPGSGNVSAAFLGVPGGEAVQWDGRYQLGVDDAGND
ncbi:MAG: SH3 domain-containing protein, partial [Anaerolineales bacterium]|nr:SH3 domain-containing protein [Anaerolineales bacterium]